ncbi:hypothetical protein [Aureimonas ureilytica]|uniref:hypothetical protein n=1 Tax=Aureimonas ureilytica TaxID=401562 RepID=UPI000364D745|nr:hypothetical protein [Aureimonas ureilytica]
MRTFSIGLALVLGLSVGARAADRRVDIENQTGETLTHFYASVTSTDDWEEDILGADMIEDGETFNIDIDDGSGSCRYDFKAVFEDGDVLMKRNINVCKIATYTYSR